MLFVVRNPVCQTLLVLFQKLNHLILAGKCIFTTLFQQFDFIRKTILLCVSPDAANIRSCQVLNQIHVLCFQVGQIPHNLISILFAFLYDCHCERAQFRICCLQNVNMILVKVGTSDILGELFLPDILLVICALVVGRTHQLGLC